MPARQWALIIVLSRDPGSSGQIRCIKNHRFSRLNTPILLPEMKLDTKIVFMQTGNITVGFVIASEQQLDWIARCGREMYTALFGSAFSKDDIEDYLLQQYAAPTLAKDRTDVFREAIVASSNGTALAFAQLVSGATAPYKPESRQPLQVDKICVSPGERFGEAAQKLLERAEQIGRQRKHDVLWLGVWEGDQQALAFYSSLGFSVYGKTGMQVGNTNTQQVLLQKNIA